VNGVVLARAPFKLQTLFSVQMRTTYEASGERWANICGITSADVFLPTISFDSIQFSSPILLFSIKAIQ
jgi:hypothetical protein